MAWRSSCSRASRWGHQQYACTCCCSAAAAGAACDQALMRAVSLVGSNSRGVPARSARSVMAGRYWQGKRKYCSSFHCPSKRQRRNMHWQCRTCLMQRLLLLLQDLMFTSKQAIFKPPKAIRYPQLLQPAMHGTPPPAGHPFLAAAVSPACMLQRQNAHYQAILQRPVSGRPVLPEHALSYARVHVQATTATSNTSMHVAAGVACLCASPSLASWGR